MKDSSPEAADRLIVSCPNCQEKYSVSANRVPPQGGRLTCRVCGGGIVLPGRRTGMGAPIVSKVPDPKLTPASAPPRARSSSSASPPGPVECPHCGKSFTPGKDRKASDDAVARSASTADSEPRSGQPARQAPETASTPKMAGRKTILVAEDTEFFLQLVKETLGAQYRMLGARTKTEALSLLGREPIDLVILDLTLENAEDGLEVLAGAAPRGLPCLIFTAGNEVDLWGDGWTRLQAKGATDLLLKGMNIEEQLLSKVAALLAHHN